MECNNAIIDLHIHSTASDGSFQPKQVLDQAVKNGLSAISITDHDTVAGVREVLALGIPESLEFITGIEISAAFPPSFGNSGSMHILGYGFSPDNPELNRTLKNQQSARFDRNPRIIEKLKELGIPVSLDAISAMTGKEEVARPHIADFLVNKGFATDIDDAFDRLLGHGKPAYVDKYRIPAKEAISLIKAAGGLAVLAHPMLIVQSFEDGPDDRSLEGLLDTLNDYGLNGIEAYYPGHTPEQTTFLINTAEKRGLLITGGTDFHGDINPGIQMGIGPGNFSVPYEIFSRLKKAGAGLAISERQKDLK